LCRWWWRVGDLQAQDLPVPVGVDPAGEECGDVHDPATFMDLHDGGVGGDKRVRPGVQGAGAEGLDVLVELGGHDADLLLDRLVMPRVSTSFSIRRVLTPNR